MKVLILFNHGKIVGGGEISFIRYINSLIHIKELEILVIVPSGGDLANFLKIDQSKIVTLEIPSFRAGPRKVVLSLLRLSKIFKDFKPDVVHANGSRVALYSGIVKLFFPKTKVIWHVRISERDILDPLLFTLSDGIIANSKKTMKRRFSIYGLAKRRDKIRIIYNGFNIEELREKLQSTRKGEKDTSELVIGSAGRLEGGKGFEYMLNFLEMLSHKEKVSALLAGSGPLKSVLKNIPRNLKTFFFDHLPLERFLVATDIVCFPSLVDSFGNLVIESMIAGKICMVSRHCGASEVYPLKELIFEPMRFNDFSRCFYLAKDLMTDERTSETLKRESLRFSIENHIREVLSFYKELSGEC